SPAAPMTAAALLRTRAGASHPPPVPTSPSIPRGLPASPWRRGQATSLRTHTPRPRRTLVPTRALTQREPPTRMRVGEKSPVLPHLFPQLLSPASYPPRRPPQSAVDPALPPGSGP